MKAKPFDIIIENNRVKLEMSREDASLLVHLLYWIPSAYIHAMALGLKIDSKDVIDFINDASDTIKRALPEEIA